MFAGGSRLGDGAAGYAVVWNNAQSWVGIKTHMGYSQGTYDAECAALARRWRPHRGDRRFLNGSRSSPMHRRPSDGWSRGSRAPAGSTRSRQGSTSPRCEGPGRPSPSRFDGARRTRGSLATKRPTSEQRLRRRSQTPAVPNGSATRTDRGRA